VKGVVTGDLRNWASCDEKRQDVLNIVAIITKCQCHFGAIVIGQHGLPSPFDD
jgi:hypothetical protein